MDVWCCWVAGGVYPHVFLLVGFPESRPPSSCLCLYFLNFCLVFPLGISESCFVIDLALLCKCVWECVCSGGICVCVTITGESMAILTKPYVKIRAWLSPCVSLLNRLIALLYGLLIAWAHVFSQWAIRVLWIWRFFAFTHCICSSVCVCACTQIFYVYTLALMLYVWLCVIVYTVCHAGWLRISLEHSPAN